MGTTRLAGWALCLVPLMMATSGTATAAGRSPARVAPALPNLVPLPPFEAELGDADPETGDKAVRISVGVANRSDYALDLLGTPEDAVGQKATAHQCIEWVTDRVCAERAPVGRFVWHPEHGHHHFEDFALYELRKIRPNGRPDMRRKGAVVSGDKVSFCLLDAEQDDEPGPSGPLYWTFWPLYASCIVGSGQQGISPGWRDVYGSSLTGQQIVIDGVPDGTYAVVVTTDPENLILETDDDDNVAAAKITLSGDGADLEHICDYDRRLRECS